MGLGAERLRYGSHEVGAERPVNRPPVRSAGGIERAAGGWDRHEDPAAMQRFRDAEKAGLRMLEQTNRIQAWDDAKKRILDLTEGRTSLVSWKVEHGDVGHKAERALLGAALGILTRDRLSHEQYSTLVRPMSEALPWLLPEAPPEPRR